MTSLDKLIQLYNDNKIDEQTLLMQIEKYAFMDEKQYDIQQERIRDKIVENTTVVYSITPEESVLEDERNKEILEFIYWTRSIIGDKDFEILCMYAVERLSYKKIGQILGVSAQAVHSRMKRIYKKIQKYIHLSPVAAEDVIGHLHEPQSTKEAGSPESIGYPYEFLRNISAGGTWRKSVRGRIYYKAKTVCLIPNYFEQAFGDKKTICTLECDKNCSIGGNHAYTR